ncbi:MAG: rhomboid family intramembrane serine protease [Bacteroidetes bacterium]|nr:rhomboid family intramembrane serine protease [Bacteroidota bacterium]
MSYQQNRQNIFSSLPLVVKNLLIINGLFFLATLAFSNQGIDLAEKLGLHYPLSKNFQPYQLVTYMFMHGSFMHLFFNMFALWMFGNTLENLWGSKRFLIYYMITGIGAGLIQIAVTYFRLMPLYSQVSPEILNMVMSEGSDALQNGKNFIDPYAADINVLINTATIGASGAVFGILLAFGMLFPNTMLYVYFAIPIKAKWFVMIYGAMELFSGIANNPQDNVAHFAHLGGMLFGFILIKYWQKKSNTFY